MASIVKNLVEYDGVADFIPQFTEKYAPIKEFNVQETLDIPTAKPDIEQIVKVKSELVITSIKVIKTPVAISLDEQRLTGWKVIIEGELKQAVQYVADQVTQPIHAAHFDVPISVFIVLPPDYEEGTCVSIDGYIEDIYAEKIGKRQIFKNTTILLVARVL